MFSRLDFRRPLTPVFDFARDGSDSRTAAGYRAYSLRQNYMEKQTPIPPAPPPDPNFKSRMKPREGHKRAILLSLIWRGREVWVFHLFWPQL